MSDSTLDQAPLDQSWDRLLGCFTRGDRMKAFWRMVWTGGVSIEPNRIGKLVTSKRGRKVFEVCRELSGPQLAQLQTRAGLHRKMVESDARAVIIPALTLPVALMAFMFEYLGETFRESGHYELFGGLIALSVVFGLFYYFSGVLKTREAQDLEALLTLEADKRGSTQP